MSRILRLFVLAGFLVLSPACGDDETLEPGPEAPALPPIASMELDLGPFLEGAAAAPAPATQFHFTNAALRAAVIHVGMALILAPPALALDAAFSVTPTRQDDDSWIWIYTWARGSVDYQVRLRGIPGEHGTEWEMRVTVPTADPPLVQELWFSGHTEDGGHEGSWTFRHLDAPGYPETLEIEWNVDSETDATLDIENVRDGTPEEGDRLVYEVNGTVSSMTFLDASTQVGWQIAWNAVDGSGYLQFPDYNDGLRSCWDGDRQDTPCPAPSLAIY